jgi:hypothetical protein
MPRRRDYRRKKGIGRESSAGALGIPLLIAGAFQIINPKSTIPNHQWPPLSPTALAPLAIRRCRELLIADCRLIIVDCRLPFKEPYSERIFPKSSIQNQQSPIINAPPYPRPPSLLSPFAGAGNC